MRSAPPKGHKDGQTSNEINPSKLGQNSWDVLRWEGQGGDGKGMEGKVQWYAWSYNHGDARKLHNSQNFVPLAKATSNAVSPTIAIMITIFT